MLLRYFFGFILFLSQHLSVAQSVWAGDVNNNGIVNKIDLLYLGYAFGEIGTPRIDTSTVWVAQNLPIAWDGNFPNGVNYLYADCNGDGIVDELDAAVIRKNAGLSHDDVAIIPEEILIGEAGINPACRFNKPPKAIPVDQVFNLEIALGDLDIAVENLSGLTFTIDVTPDIIGLSDTKFTFKEDAWIDPNPEQTIQLQQRDTERARLKVALAKTDRIPVSGFGPLATVSFIVIGDLVDFLMVDSVTFMIDSITVLDDALNPIPIVPDTIKLAVDKNLTVNTIDLETTTKIAVYPNPNKGVLLIASNGIVLEKIELINGLGQQVFTEKLSNTTFQSIDFQYLEKGIYYMKIYSKKGVTTKTLHKTN